MEPPIDRYWSIAAIASQDHPRLRANSCSFSSSQSSSMVIRCGRSFGKPLSRHKLQEKWSLGKIVSKPCVSVNWQEVIFMFFFGFPSPNSIQKHPKTTVSTSSTESTAPACWERRGKALPCGGFPFPIPTHWKHIPTSKPWAVPKKGSRDLPQGWLGGFRTYQFHSCGPEDL